VRRAAPGHRGGMNTATPHTYPSRPLAARVADDASPVIRARVLWNGATAPSPRWPGGRTC
ncbi:MAG: hypothetical protein ACK5Y8_04405, partial [Betaproteobacteria bacterium]